MSAALVMTEMGLQVHDGPAELASDRVLAHDFGLSAKPGAELGMARRSGTISVVPHPAGGWTLACPVGGSCRVYRGQYDVEASAQRAAWCGNVGGAM